MKSSDKQRPKILIIDLTTNPLHRMEFVKPIEDILKSENMDFETVHHSKYSKNNNIRILQKSLKDFSKIIIPGTSLKDFNYARDIDDFRFLLDIGKPMLGICAGMQLLCMIHGCHLIKGSEIGFQKMKFEGFLGFSEERMVYCMHNMTVKDDAALRKAFTVQAMTKYVQAVKHKQKPIYGMLFHPESRNKDFITKFLYYNNG